MPLRGPLVASAQQTTMPVIGFLRGSALKTVSNIVPRR